MANLVEVLARAIRKEVWHEREKCDAAREILIALEAAGYRVVPVEPTEEMVRADCPGDTYESDRYEAVTTWANMLNAAPKITDPEPEYTGITG